VGARWEAPKRLGGFAKLDVRPAAAAQASVTIDPRLLAVYDAPTKRWNVAAGDYRVILAASAADDKAQETTVRLEAASYDVHGKPLRTRAAP
jgi:beta-glucosidase